MLNEKNIPYDITYIDLRNKPDWFLDMSPAGKVPVVQLPDGDVLFESAVINEYLDEVHEPHLMPTAPLARAKTRMWIEFTSYLFGDVYRLYTAVDKETAEKQAEAARARLEKMMAAFTGPFFEGDQFGLIDAAVCPAVMRLDWVAQIAPELDVFQQNAQLAQWRESLLARPSVQNSVLPDIFDIFVESLRSNDRWLATQL